MTFDIRPTLADIAYADVTTFFATKEHFPSDEQMAAIRDLLDHLELAARGQLETALHVSAIPAGIGKSVSVAKFAAALMASPAHSVNAA
jgi:hypothetical protein